MGHVDQSNSGSNKLLTYYLCTTYNRESMRHHALNLALSHSQTPLMHPCWDWGLGTRLDYMSTDIFGKGGH